MTVEHAVESQSQVRVPNEKTKGTRTAVPTPALRISTGVYSTTGRLHTCSWSYLNLVRGGTGGGVMVGSKWRTSSPSRVASDARPTKRGVAEAWSPAHSATTDELRFSSSNRRGKLSHWKCRFK